MLTPSCPVSLLQRIISTDHCISVTGDVSGSQSPPQCQNARRSPAI
ncbi:unnamed protein product, partial [Staurois parvus]